MNQYKLNESVEDLEKKLYLHTYNEMPLNEKYHFNDKRYEIYADILINKNTLDLEYMINRLERYFQAGIFIKNRKLEFHSSE